MSSDWNATAFGPPDRRDGRLGLSKGIVANPNPELHPENLRPCKPGETHNPAGYSRGRRLADELVKLMKADEGYTKFAAVGFKAAMAADFKFWSYIFDRHSPVEQDAEIDLETVAREMRAKHRQLIGPLGDIVDEAEQRAEARKAKRLTETQAPPPITPEVVPSPRAQPKPKPKPDPPAYPWFPPEGSVLMADLTIVPLEEET